MRKIVIGMHAGMAGTDAWEFYEFPDTVTDDELSSFAWQEGVHHAEAYGIYPESHYTEEEIAESPESYSDSIEGWWEEYDAKKHDCHTMTGTPQWMRG